MSRARGTALYTLIVDAETPAAEVIGQGLFDAGAQGIEERDGDGLVSLRVHSDTRREVDRLAAAVAAEASFIEARLGRRPDVRIRIHETRSDWMTRWTRHLRPTWMTARAAVCPHGSEPPATARRVIFVHPTLAFGLGNHPTTQMAAERVEEWVERKPGARVLDVGTGSGVLALLALLEGASEAVGLDVEPLAIESARYNAALNDLSNRSDFELGSFESASGTFDIVVANIDAPTHITATPGLRSMLAPGGVAILAGIPSHSLEDVLDAQSAAGLSVSNVQQEGDWSALEVRI